MRAEKPDRDPINPRRRAVIVAGGALVLGAAFRPLRAAAQTKQRIGVIGSGHIGGTIGGLWVKAGHPVLFSSRHPDELKDLVAGLGELAQAGTVDQAIAFSDVLFIAVPYGALPQIGRDYGAALKGKIMLDACNAVARARRRHARRRSRAGRRRRRLAEIFARRAAGARLQHPQLQDLRQRGEPARSEACGADRRRRSRSGQDRGRTGARRRLRSGRRRQACRRRPLSARRAGLRPGGHRGRAETEALARAIGRARAGDPSHRGAA